MEPEAPQVEVPAAPATETEVAQPQEQVTSPQTEAQGQEPPKKDEANPVQNRINQLTRQRYEAERRANAAILAQQQAEERARALEAQALEIARRYSTPKFEQFPDPEQYQRALDAHNQQFYEQQQRRSQEDQQARAQMQAAAQFQARLDSYKAQGMEQFPDFEQVVNNPALPNLPSVNRAVVDALLEDPALAYYYGKHPDEAWQIAGMPPARAVMEVGKVAAKLAATPAKTVTAPAPPATVGGNQRASNEPSDRDSIEEWVRKRNAQLRARNA